MSIRFATPDFGYPPHVQGLHCGPDAARTQPSTTVRYSPWVSGGNPHYVGAAYRQ